MRSRPTHRSARLLIPITLGAVLLAACDGDDPEADPTDGPDEVEDLTDDPDEDDDPATDPDDEVDPDEDGDADGNGDADAAPDPDDDEDEGSDADDETDGVALATEETDGTSEEDGEFDGDLAVTDVRVGSHDGFDRVTFELTGDATVGWFVGPEDEPTSQGSGEPVEVEGEAYLGVALRNVTLPPELPDGIEPWDGERLATPADAALLQEVVDDTIFEGIHLFYLGLDEQVSYRIDRLEDPQRVVIDLVEDP